MIIIAIMLSCIGRTTESNVISGINAQEAKNGAPKTFQQKPPDYAPGEILVKFVQGTDQQTIDPILKKLHLKVIRKMSSSDLYLIKIADDSAIENIIKKLNQFKEVSYSEPNYIITIDFK
jgi:thermitase